jgi:uncharacterized membrane protein YkvA (DUF1232 family)
VKKLKEIGERFKRELRFYRLVLNDERTPRISKIFLGMAVGYILMPFDLIPDFIPVLGQLDDLVIVPLLVVVAMRWIPKEVVDSCRVRAGGDGA